MASLHGITLKMATVVTAQDSGSLRGRSGWRSHGNRRKERGKWEGENSTVWEAMGDDWRECCWQMLALVYVSQLIRRADYAALVSK